MASNWLFLIHKLKNSYTGMQQKLTSDMVTDILINVERVQEFCLPFEYIVFKVTFIYKHIRFLQQSCATLKVMMCKGF